PNGSFIPGGQRLVAECNREGCLSRQNRNQFTCGEWLILCSARFMGCWMNKMNLAALGAAAFGWAALVAAAYGRTWVAGLCIAVTVLLAFVTSGLWRRDRA